VSGPHDIFICHTATSAAHVKRLTAALAARGMSCFTCEAGLSIELQPKLATSKCFLVWASEDFFRSRACQAHLAMAWIARQQEPANAPERILVVNAESGLKHIYPLLLRERIVASAPGLPEAPDPAELAATLQERCGLLTGTLGGLYPQGHGGWLEPYDCLSQPQPHFAGRERELWDIHTALNPPDPGFAPHRPAPLVVVSGESGLGKTALAREYVFRFGAAYTGGIFLLSAHEARPAARLKELAINPDLKAQLLALLRQRQPDSPLREGDELAAIAIALKRVLAERGRPFLWIVENLPRGINGPVLQQWLAPVPPEHAPAPGLGGTILISHTQRYDQRGESIHLPILDENAGRQAITQGRPPRHTEEAEAVDWLLEEIGRHPRYAAMIAALAEAHRPQHRRVFAWLLHKLEKPGREAIDLVREHPGQFPEGREAVCAMVLLESLRMLEGPARDILRLAAELEDHPLPLDLIADSLVLGGLSPDDRKEYLFAVLLNEPEEVPLTAEAAREYVEQGAASLARHALAERTDHGIRIDALVAKILHRIIPPSPRQILLREAALQALYIIAENCHARDDWRRLAAVAPHGRKLIADLRERTIEAEDSAPEITGRIRLALHLADLDLQHGARQRATGLYRATSAYLLRAMAADPLNGSRQRDFARIQEQLGDLTAAEGDLATALEHYRKSLGIRVFMARQENRGRERIQDPLRLHLKISQRLEELGDLDSALQSQQAAHAFQARLARHEPENPDVQFDLAASHRQLAELHIARNESQSALNELERALPLYEASAALQAGHTLRHARAIVDTHSRIGDLLKARDDLSGALNRYRTALAIADHAAMAENRLTEWLSTIALCHKYIGDTLSGLDDPQEAELHYQAFLEIAEHPDHRSLFEGILQRNIAVVYIRLGKNRDRTRDWESALACYRKARTLVERLAIELPDNLLLRGDLNWLRNKITRLKERQEAERRRLLKTHAHA